MKKIILFFTTILAFNNIQAQCWKEISGGGKTSMALKEDGSLWSWGSNAQGQLGDSSYFSKLVPTQVGSSIHWVKISTSWASSYGLKDDGTIWGWGNNWYGQLGNGTNGTGNNLLIPTQIGTDNNWQEISGGNGQAFGIKLNGTLWAWGSNYNGELGDGTNIDKLVPVQVGTDSTWKIIEPGSLHSLALKTNGTLWAWGYNGLGELGDGTTINKNTPVQIGADTNWKSISAGQHFSLGIKSDGTLWAWGQNNLGQLGDGTYVDKISPTQIGTDTNWKSISAGTGNYEEFSLAIKTNATLWAWGNNYHGQLGDSTNIGKNYPIQIGTENNWSKISTGDFHTMALKTNGQFYACGFNLGGQLGDSTTIDKNILTYIPTTNCYPSAINPVNIISNDINIFPNPTSSIINIETQNQIIKTTLLNLNGRIIIEQSNSYKQLNISSLPSGLYILKIITPQGVFNQKITIEK